jgi:methionyl aminopeptidase
LVKTSRECLEKAIAIGKSCPPLFMSWWTDLFALVKPGVRYRDLGKVITDHATKNGFSVVRTICGHGINQLFHCAPNVPHYASKSFFLSFSIELTWYIMGVLLVDNKAVGIMKPGHVFTIEPMICEGTWRDELW